MAEVTDFVSNILMQGYSKFSSFFGIETFIGIQVLFFAVVLAIVSLFVWQFYKSTSKMNLIELNLRKYNWSQHPIMSKISASVLYLIEYIIVMPLLILLWYAALSVVLLLIASERPVNQVLLVAAVLIGAIRILAYIKGEISTDLAKLFPFIALSLFILSPDLFNANEIFAKIKEVPLLLNNIFSFIVVIVGLEIVLRVFYTLYDFWKSEEEL